MMGKIVGTDIAKWFGEGESRLDVFTDLNFDITDREFAVIVGPSGCGKTTLLRMMMGLVEPSDGDVLIDGAPVTEPRDEVAMVFQNFELLPWRSVIDNVALGLEIQGMAKDERFERAREWIERAGLDGFESSYPNELSGGMQQRVGLARALVTDPDVLLMDEPFGALDAQTKDRMQTYLLELWEEQKKTVAFVTHDIQEAIFLGDRVFVMSEKPARFTKELRIDFDRPRWKRRMEIENDDQFAEYEQAIRAELGLMPTHSDTVS